MDSCQEAILKEGKHLKKEKSVATTKGS